MCPWVDLAGLPPLLAHAASGDSGRFIRTVTGTVKAAASGQPG
jgi:hypothetical protein